MCSASSVAAILQANCDTSKLVMRSTPLLPASSACHTSGTLFPTAQIIPIPVTTTRRGKLLWSFRVRVDVIHRVLDGADILRVLVRDLDLEGFFEGHDQLDRVERISAEVVHERRVGRHLALFHAQLFHNDLLYAFIYGCHEVSNLLWFRRPLGGEKPWPVAPDGARYFLALACCSMYDTASCTVRIFSASSSGISISKASSKAMTNSTVSSESAPRSSTKDAPGVTSASSTPNCSTMICLTRSSVEAIDFSCRAGTSVAAGKPVSLIAEIKPCKPCLRLSGRQETDARALSCRRDQPDSSYPFEFATVNAPQKIACEYLSVEITLWTCLQNVTDFRLSSTSRMLDGKRSIGSWLTPVHRS